MTAVSESAVPFPVPDYRFDQKNEVFKRAAWDEALRPLAQRFYTDIVYQERAGYRQEDYALRNASWHLEWGSGFGNSRSNSGLYSWDEVSPKLRPYLDRATRIQGDPLRLTRLVKEGARFLGADLVGVASVHPHWVYSHEYDLIAREHRPFELPEGCHRAVVVALAMDYEAMRSSPTALAGAATGLGYSRMAYVAHLLAVFIRGLGYKALPSGNDTALSVPLAMAAGLGEAGRMGLLITERFGPRVRLCKVFTDMPLVADSFRPFGVWEFCRTCKTCAHHCPSRAIPDGEPTPVGPNVSSHSGIRKWYVNGEKCFEYWAQNRQDCAVCIRVCPFNKAPGLLHDLVRTTVKHTSKFNPFFVRMDRAMGYDRMIPASVYWRRRGVG
ncbi:MAG: reductive dehalogenase [Actinobacteria bacterium]|nr:reductive dehalogenase [Actinomycetota bacterium]